MALDVRLEVRLGRNGSVIRKTIMGKLAKKKVTAKTATLFLTAFVVYDAEGSDVVRLAVAGEKPDGIIIGTQDGVIDLSKDSDSPYAILKKLHMYVPQKGDEIYVTVATQKATTFNGNLTLNAGFVEAFGYVDGVIATDTLISFVGKAQNAVTAVASTEKIALMIAGGI